MPDTQMQQQADVTVVIPAYNAVAFLADALDSIAAQQTQPLEVVVVDDGSKDETAALARRWAAAHPTAFDVQVVEQVNGGIAKARNTAIARARGHWVAFLDADDVWLPEHLTLLLAAAASVPGALVAYGAGRLFQGKKIEEALYDDYWDNPSRRFGQPVGDTGFLRVDRHALPRMVRGNFIKPTSAIVLRSALQTWGVFDESLRTAEDRELLARLLLRGSFVYCATPVSLYRWHADNASQVKNAKRNLESGIQAVLRIQVSCGAEMDAGERQAAQGTLLAICSDYLDLCAMHGLPTLLAGRRFLMQQVQGMQPPLFTKPRRLAKSLWVSAKSY